MGVRMICNAKGKGNSFFTDRKTKDIKGLKYPTQIYSYKTPKNKGSVSKVVPTIRGASRDSIPSIYYFLNAKEIGQNNFASDQFKDIETKIFAQEINLSNRFHSLNKKVEPSDHQQKRCQKLRSYMDSLKSKMKDMKQPEFSEKAIDLSWSVWEKLKKLLSQKGLSLEVPNASPGLSNNFMYVWKKNDHYLECEIFENGEIEFFYINNMDRKDEELWTEDTTFEQNFSDDILDKVSLFTE